MSDNSTRGDNMNSAPEITVSMSDSIFGPVHPADGYRGWIKPLLDEFALTPEERAARDAVRRAKVEADDLARGPVVELPAQDPATPTLYLVITEGYYDSSTVHGIFTSREQAEDYMAAERTRYASLPKAQQDYSRAVLDAEIQAWRGREQIEGDR
jgi:hypothetical protein